MTTPLRPQSAERPAMQKFRTALNALYLEVEPSIANDIVDLANAAITEAEAYARAAAAESRKHNWKCVAPENGYYRWQCQNPGCSETAPYPSVLPDSSCAYSAALPVGESPAAAPQNADRREIVTPADPHDCRCGERGADGTGEHYQIVADVETKRGTRVPVCVNHIGNYAAYPDNYRISIRAAAPAAPLPRESNKP